MARERRDLPRLAVEKAYTLETANGPRSLAELFDGRPQLLIYHFMFGPSYAAGCPVNSSIADTFDSLIPHLKARDVTLIAVSGAPIEKLVAYRERMGWSFEWASSYESAFNTDVGFSTSLEQTRAAVSSRLDTLPAVALRNAEAVGTDIYGYLTELFGFTAFALEDGVVYQTYTTTGRGVEFLMPYYGFLDRAPRGATRETAGSCGSRDTTNTTGMTRDQRLLLASAQAGDERAFRRLIEPYQHALEVHCYRMLGSAQDAEDLSQETLLRAWRSLERFEPRAQFQSWIYRIATNACLDELERRPRRPEPVDPFPQRHADEAESPTYDPAARYAIREGVELAVLRAIQELPGRQRAVLIFRDVLGWTAPEVAEVLESTVASVTSALQRARATIEQHLPEAAASAADPTERDLLNRYVAAFEHADMDALLALLREDAVLRMPPQPSVTGGLAIARFFLDAVARGDLTRIRHTPTWANGRPAITVQFRAEDGSWTSEGIGVLEIEAGQIVGIDAFLDPALVPRFGVPAGC